MRIIPLVIAVFMSVKPVEAYENVDSILRNMELGEVVVTATRTPKFLSEAPIHTRLISHSDILKCDASNIQDLLQMQLPNVEFSYAMNQQRHLNFSGFGGQGVLFLVDGERIAGETLDDIDFSRITLNNVSHIEVVKGASSALYGSNAVGGVVNIITKESVEPWTLNLNARIGRHREQRYGGLWTWKGNYLSNSLSVDFSRADNYYLKNASNPVTRVISTVYGDKVANINDKIIWNPTSSLKITARLGGFFRQTARTEDIPERYRGFSGGMRADWDISEFGSLMVGYSFDQYDKSDFQRLSKLEIRDYSNVQNSFRVVYNHIFSKIVC